MKPHILLVCLDTLRADAYRNYAPRLRGQADVNIDTCRAVAPWSVPSHGSMFTGELPHKHGCHAHDRTFNLDPSETFLGDLDGYKTQAVSANVYAGPIYGFDALFDEMKPISPSCRYPDGMDVQEFIQTRENEGIRRFAEFGKAVGSHDETLKSILNGGLLKLDDALRELPVPKFLDDGAKILSREIYNELTTTTDPTFLFANFMDVHASHEHVFGYDRSLHPAGYKWSSRDFDAWEINTEGSVPPELEGDLENHRGLYRAAVDYVDRVVSDLIDELETDVDRPIRVVITADHGENLGFESPEGLLLGHTSSLSEDLLRVPLSIVNPPEGIDPPEGWVSHLDLGEIILNLARDRSTIPTREVVPSEVIGSGTNHPTEYWDRAIRTVVEDTHKVTWDSTGQVDSYTVGYGIPYDITKSDGKKPEYFDTPLKDAKQDAKENTREVSVDEQTKQRLEELGYR